MRMQFAFGTAEEVSVIDEEGSQPTAGGFYKNGLSIVDISGADIDQPGQPEIFMIVNPVQTGPGQNFQQAYVFPTQEARAEAHT